jgi:hypothetical protein
VAKKIQADSPVPAAGGDAPEFSWNIVKELEILENYTRTFTTVYTRYDEDDAA